MQTDLLEQMDQLLAAEKVALMTANYDALASLEQQKAQTLVALSKEPQSEQALDKIRTRIAENQALLSAAINGIASARQRFDALNNVQNGLTVYDQFGRMEVVPSQQSVFEKKA